ncbi:MAG: YjgF/chorismate mutase-like domain containing protein [Cenarchaeum symbiont of Oopsacas minuta]|nr:YjgF/chorismate mutase-like domain containing protein [Cenarchaeum symbiont of Oopsacas minuta]
MAGCMIDEKLIELGIILPDPPTPAGAYMPVIVADGMAFVSGQIPMLDGRVKYTGKVGESNISTAKESAKLCAVNILAQLQKELGSLEKIKRIVRINGFVNSEPGFKSHPNVIDAVSDFFYEILGERGRHSRLAVGVMSLPLDAMTEVDAIVQIHT